MADFSHPIIDGFVEHPGGSGRCGRRHGVSVRPGARAEFSGLLLRFGQNVLCIPSGRFPVSLSRFPYGWGGVVTKPRFERHVLVRCYDEQA